MNENNETNKTIIWLQNNRKTLMIGAVVLAIIILIIYFTCFSGKETRENLTIDDDENIINQDGTINVDHEKKYTNNLLYKHGYDLIQAVQNQDKSKREELSNKIYALTQSAFCRNAFETVGTDSQLEESMDAIYRQYKAMSKTEDGQKMILNMPAFFIDSLKLRNKLGLLIFTMSEAAKNNNQILKNIMLSALTEIGRDNACFEELKTYTFKQPKVYKGKKIWSSIWSSSLKKDEQGRPIWKS